MENIWILSGIIFSLLLVPLIDAGITDIWEKCDESTLTTSFCIKELATYFCYKDNSGVIKWNESGPLPAETACSDGYDNDCDGRPDKKDIDCDSTPPTFTIQYYFDASLLNSLGSNPRLSSGTVYLKITASETLDGAPKISIIAEGSANDVTNEPATLVSGNVYKYARTITADAAAVGIILEDIFIAGKDLAGNIANPNPLDEETKAAYTDTKLSAITLTSVGSDSAPPYETNDNTPNVVLTTDENAWCKLSQIDQAFNAITQYWTVDCIGWGTTSHTCTSEQLADGQRNIYVGCKDLAGNAHTSTDNMDITVRIDTVTDTRIDSGPPNIVASTSATFTFSCVDETCASFECKLDAGSFSLCTSPQLYSLLSEGPHVFQVRGKDTIGNIDQTPATRPWTIDTTPPLRTNGQPSGMITTSSPLLSINTNEAATCKYSTTAGRSYDLMTNTFSTTGGTSHSQLISGLSSGNYNYYVRCSDTVGNYNTDDSQISFSVCSRSNPTVAITPTYQSGKPGSTLPYTVQVTNNDQNCGTETFNLIAIGCPSGWTCALPSSLSISSGSTSPTTLSITSPSSATDGNYIVNVEAKNQVDNSMKNTAPATYTIQCSRIIGIKSMPYFDTMNKLGSYNGIQYTWILSFTDSSTSSCPTTIDYQIPSLSFTQVDCHPQVGLYSSASNPPAGISLNTPYKFSIPRGGALNNAFKVFVERNGPNSCILSFQIQSGGIIVDPSFTVRSSGVSNQPPYVSSFDYSGDKSSLNVNWQTFYPDDNPFRDMKVECGLNCDPELQDCSKIAGKGCLPYDTDQGTQDVKKGSCTVSSPSFDFTNDKIMCLFYDPSDTRLKSRVDQPFTAIDFDVRATDKITTTVGHPFDLKIDISNKGKLKDSYKIELSGSGTIDISPTTITTPVIDLGQLVSTFSSITPLVNQQDTITLKIMSITSGKVVTKDINISSGLFALPEFGLSGFLQIIVISVIVYFLSISKLVKRQKDKTIESGLLNRRII